MDINNLWGDMPVDPEQTSVVKENDIDPIHLQIHLGHHSSYVGYMDTIDKVREHLAAMNHYDTVRANLLGKPIQQAQPTLFGGSVVQQVPEDGPEPEVEREMVRRPKERVQTQSLAVSSSWHDKVEQARQDWRRLVARRDQLEEEIKEAREHLAWMRANPPT